MEEKNLSEQESLKIISEMIQKARSSFHENGTSAILWGSVIAVCGLVSFAELKWKFDPGFDVWLLTLVAFIPQAFISIRERKQKRVISHTESALNTVWVIYALSIFGLVFYMNTAPGVVERTLAEQGYTIVTTKAGVTAPYHSGIPSGGSLFLLLYAIPTLATGWVHKFRPMVAAAMICYGFFIVSCYVPTAYDMLLNGLAGIFNWLIPGLILRQRFNRQQIALNV